MLYLDHLFINSLNQYLNAVKRRLEKDFNYFLFILFQYERLKRIHAELEEKLEASEIQIKRQSAEYRTLMQQKDVRSDT